MWRWKSEHIGRSTGGYVRCWRLLDAVDNTSTKEDDVKWVELTAEQRDKVINYLQDHPEYQPIGPSWNECGEIWDGLSEDEQEEILTL